MATTNVVWVDGQPYSPNHPKALAQYRKDMDQYRKSSEKVEYEIATPPSLGRELKDKVAKRLRQDSKPLMNKLETEYMELLKRKYFLEPPFRAQAITFRIGNGVRFTPDITGYVEDRPTAWEIKGKFAWDDAKVKIKVVAGLYPEWRWILVWKEDGQWREQIILP